MSTVRSGPVTRRSMAVAKRVAELEAQLTKTRAERDELLRDVETLCMQVPARLLVSIKGHIACDVTVEMHGMRIFSSDAQRSC